MKFLYGPILKDMPKTFAPPEMWPEYAPVTDPVALCRREVVQEDPVAVRWALWPITFELYWGDTEPDIAAARHGELAYHRIAFWRRLTRTDVPRGWHRGASGPFRIDGHQLLDGGDFTRRWHKNARRDLSLWHKQFNNHTHIIEEVSIADYADAYTKSLIAGRLGNERLHNLKDKLAYPLTQQHTKLYGVRNRSTGEVVAGTGVIYSPRYKSSTHFAPFIREEARHIYAATALMYHWFAQSRANGMPAVITTNFWHKGLPKGWKGFSEFKSHFGFEYVTYPPVLWRPVRGKLF